MSSRLRVFEHDRVCSSTFIRAYCLVLAAYFFLPCAFCFMPCAFCLVPSVLCLMPMTVVVIVYQSYAYDRGCHCASVLVLRPLLTPRPPASLHGLAYADYHFFVGNPSLVCQLA